MEVEKNDVDISKLFHWGRVFELVGNDGKEVTLVYMRVLGDADVNRSRVFALRESALLRRKLKDLNSDERLVNIRDIEDLDKESLVNLNIALSTRDMTQRFFKEIKLKYPKQPDSDAPLEEMEKYQKEVDEFPAKREEAIREAVTKQVELMAKELKKKTQKDLYQMYVDKAIGELCEIRALHAFREMSTYLGCYADDEFKKPFFQSFDEFLNLSTEQKQEFISAYQTLEIGTEEIKKLREATP